MSIDARVKSVRLREDGSGELRLADRPTSRAGDTSGIAGQRALRFSTAPEEVTALNGLNIWGSADTIMLGDVQIAYRKGYTNIVFVDTDKFNEAVAKYRRRQA